MTDHGLPDIAPCSSGVVVITVVAELKTTIGPENPSQQKNWKATLKAVGQTYQIAQREISLKVHLFLALKELTACFSPNFDFEAAGLHGNRFSHRYRQFVY